MATQFENDAVRFATGHPADCAPCNKCHTRRIEIIADAAWVKQFRSWIGVGWTFDSDADNPLVRLMRFHRRATCGCVLTISVSLSMLGYVDPIDLMQELDTQFELTRAVRRSHLDECPAAQGQFVEVPDPQPLHFYTS